MTASGFMSKASSVPCRGCLVSLLLHERIKPLCGILKVTRGHNKSPSSLFTSASLSSHLLTSAAIYPHSIAGVSDVIEEPYDRRRLRWETSLTIELEHQAMWSGVTVPIMFAGTMAVKSNVRHNISAEFNNLRHVTKQSRNTHLNAISGK